MPNYTDPFSNKSFDYVDPFAEEQQDAKEGFWGETLDYVQDRAGDFVGYAGRALSKGAQFVGNNPALGAVTPAAGLMQEQFSKDAAKYVEGKSQELIDHDFGFDAQNNEYSWEKVKDNKDIGTLAGFITREGLGSAPEMLSMLSGFGLAAYGVSATERMAEERARNNNKERASLEDYSIAAPTAMATLLLDKFGFDKALGAIKQGAFKRNIAASAGAEAGTEFLQESLESTATTLGTETGFDLATTLDQGLAGAIAGGGMGAALNTTAQITESLRGNPNSPDSIKLRFESDIEQIKQTGREAEARGEPPEVINAIKQRLNTLNAEYDAFLRDSDPGFVKGNVNRQEQAKTQAAQQGGDALDQANAAANVASTIADDVASESDALRQQAELDAQQNVPAFQRKNQQEGLMAGVLGDTLIERDQVRINPMQVWQPNFTMPGNEQEQVQQVDGEFIANSDFPQSVPVGNTLGFDESVGAIDAMPENRVGQSDTIQAQDRTAELDAQEQYAPPQIEQKDVIFAEDNRFRTGTDRATIRRNGNPFPTVKSVHASRSYRDAVESGITPEIVKVGNGFGWETKDDIEAVEPQEADAPLTVGEATSEVTQPIEQVTLPDSEAQSLPDTVLDDQQEASSITTEAIESLQEPEAQETVMQEPLMKLDSQRREEGDSKIERAVEEDEVALFRSPDDTGSLAASNSTAVSSADANKVIDSIASTWSGDTTTRRDEFVVASTYNDLPSEIKDAAKKQSAEGKVYGVFHNGKTYIVSDKHRSTQELETTIFHETYGHHGMKKLFGNEITQKMNQLFVANGGITGLRKTAEKHGIDLNLYEKGTEKAGMPQEVRNRVLMEELLAHMQQDNKPSVKRIAKEVVGYIRQKLRDLGFAKLANVSDSDLFYILKQSRDAVRKGSVKGGDTRFMVVKASREMDQSGIDKVRKAAEAIVSGGYFKKAKINLGETPKVLQLLGASNADFMFDPTKLFDTVKPGRKHELTVEQAVEAIKHIADPVAVFDSITHKGSKVVLTEVMSNNAPVVAAIHIGQDGALQSVNKLASVYAKTGNFNKWINESISQSETIYVNKQKRQALESEGAVQFRLENPDSPLGEFKLKIVDETDLVKFEENDTSLFRAMDDSAPQSFTAPVEKKWSKDWFKRKLQDKFAPIKDMQASIEKATGQELSEDQDTYRAEELFYGKTENDLNKMEQDHVKPLVDAMTQNNIQSGELDQYLIAKHAKERNAHIASINPEMPNGGSGMTNAEADEILARYEQEGKLAGLSIAANEVYKITEKRRELLRESGLEDEALLDVWDANYQFYVPLKGYAADSEGNTVAKTGSGFDIRGRESMRAMGRRTIAESPTAHAIQDLSATIIRSRKNEVGQTFLNMVESNPSPEIWEVFTEENPDTERRIVNGEVKENQPIDMRSRKDDYFSVKVDGKSKYIKLKDKDGLLMNAMKNMGPEQMNTFTKSMSAVTRWLSVVNTSLNPEFTVTNFTRDIQTALFNALAEQDLVDGKVKDKSIAKDMVKGTGKAVKALWKHSAGKLDSNDPMHTWIEEFLADGAKTGYFDSKDVDKIGSEMADLLDITNGTNRGKLLKAKNKIADFIENTNGGIENGVRLSAYIEARRAGVSRSKAASFAKNLTVNFNRKGEMGTFLNSIYMFFNAAIQGNTNFARAIVTPKVDEITGKKSMNTAQKVAAGITASAFGWSMLMREIGGEDEDGVPYWDKVPKGVRERNLVILKPWAEGEYYKVPLPYGYNIFYNLGDAAEAAINSDTRKAGDLAGELALSVYASFVPLGSPVGDNGAESLALVAAPTIAKPIVELATNKNFFGGEIYRENDPYGAQLRDSQMSMRSTGEVYKSIARWMNDVVGDGRNYKVDGESPWYDVSPDTIEHLVEFSLGGLYRFNTRVQDNLNTVTSGGDVSADQVPFVRQLNGEIQPYEDIRQFYEARQQLKNIEAELKSLRGEERMEFRKEYGDKYRLRGLMSSLDKRMKLLRKQRDRIETDDSLSFVDREKELERIQKKMKTTAAEFNRRWNEVN